MKFFPMGESFNYQLLKPTFSMTLSEIGLLNAGEAPGKFC